MKIKLNVQKLIQWCVATRAQPDCGQANTIDKTLKCIAKYGDNPIEVAGSDFVGDVYVEEFDIWFCDGEYTIIESPPEVLVAITGNNAVGKTAVMEFIATQCKSIGLKIEVDYGTDGNPRRSLAQRRAAIEHIKSLGTVVKFVEKYR